MEKEKIVKKYFKLHNAIKKEKQFNRKVELNSNINQFKKDNDLTVKVCDPISILSINGMIIAYIRKNYSNKKINLEYKELKKESLIII